MIITQVFTRVSLLKKKNIDPKRLTDSVIPCILPSSYPINVLSVLIPDLLLKGKCVISAALVATNKITSGQTGSNITIWSGSNITIWSKPLVSNSIPGGP